MQIPPWPQADEREADLLRMVLESPQWGGFHPFVAEFEQSFAAFQQAKYGLSLCNGTLAMELLLGLLEIGPGDEVIVPAISFITTATAVSRVGATPVFVDIEGDSYNINPERVREAITPKTKAVFAVHFGGTICNMQALLDICREHGLTLLEDAAHAHGAEWNGRRAGAFGLASTFSFQNGKVLTAGEGGILLTSDDNLAERARSVANCGRVIGRSFYEHTHLGTNFRLTAFQAAVLLAQFERLPAQNAQRAANASFLRESLADRKEIVWQSQPAGQTHHPFYLLVGRLHGNKISRDAFCHLLASQGVPCTPFYPHTLYRNPLYRNGGACRVMPCPMAEARVLDAFWLPHRLLLAGRETIGKVADAVTATLSGRQPGSHHQQAESHAGRSL
jgi:dTDP-4-amino-4,6-dideoxygalactose transaminase